MNSTDMHFKIGELIWETSRRDEGSISVTGANIIARAILARFELIEKKITTEAPEPAVGQVWRAKKSGRLRVVTGISGARWGNVVWEPLDGKGGGGQKAQHCWADGMEYVGEREDGDTDERD